jgi:hypothetical protein
MSLSLKPLFLVLGVAAVAGCVSLPVGPSRMALPGTGRSFDEFKFDDGGCRQYAYDQIGGQTAARAQEESGARSAILGTAIGAVAGAAIGGGHGAAVGAGVGLVGGSVAGANAANVSGYGAQERYDMAYTQCMYAKGHRVPASGRFSSAPVYSAPPPVYSAPPRAALPPPPPGAPPPPPPGTSW